MMALLVGVAGASANDGPTVAVGAHVAAPTHVTAWSGPNRQTLRARLALPLDAAVTAPLDHATGTLRPMLDAGAQVFAARFEDPASGRDQPFSVVRPRAGAGVHLFRDALATVSEDDAAPSRALDAFVSTFAGVAIGIATTEAGTLWLPTVYASAGFGVLVPAGERGIVVELRGQLLFRQDNFVREVTATGFESGWAVRAGPESVSLLVGPTF